MEAINEAVETVEKEVYTGKVVWFSKQTGIGFIAPDDPNCNAGKDVFCHFTNLQMEGFKFVNQDDIVSFTLGENKKGIEARTVVVIKAAPLQNKRKYAYEE